MDHRCRTRSETEILAIPTVETWSRSERLAPSQQSVHHDDYDYQLDFWVLFWLVAAHLFSAEVVGLTAALVSASTIVVLLASLGVCGMLIQSMPSQNNAEEWSMTFWAGIAIAVVLSRALGCATIIVLPLFAHDLDSLHRVSYRSE